MKKVLALLLCFTLFFCCCACGEKDELLDGEEVVYESGNTSLPVSSDESSTQETGKEDEKVFDTGMNLVQSGDVIYPDISLVYYYASIAYKDIVYSSFSYDKQLGSIPIKVGNSTKNYWCVNDPRFDSVAELEEHLKAFFTEECLATFYNPSRFTDYKGKLYAVVGTSVKDSTYAGCSFKLTKQTNKRIFFEGTAYHYKSMEGVDITKPTFTVAPADKSIYNTRTVEFVLELAEDNRNWRFSKFDILG